MVTKYTDLNLATSILLGPGPSLVPPRVLRAMAHPLVGHLDPAFVQMMGEVQELLRYIFQTENHLTLPVSGTGSAGMEAALCNFIEPGDRVLVGVNGFFGQRICDMTGRYGAEVRRIERPLGDVFAVEEVEAALRQKPAKIVALVHGETSTGALQPMEGLAEVVHRHGALLAIDCVASLGGVAVTVDAWDVDVAYSGTQKCLSCPPGLAPLTVSPRAVEVLAARKTPVVNWMLDLQAMQKSRGPDRTYHHTAPVNMNYALREALRLVYEEGLEQRFERHLHHAQLLWTGLEALGLQLQVPLSHRLPVVTAVRIPDGVDDLAFRRRLRSEYNIEIAGGMGAGKGLLWRIGLMGYSCRREHVELLLSAFQELL
jgi:alanine-glyoxylate transaminase/serine-glyoxylate transaminase/serine-pyruvate transaminase